MRCWRSVTFVPIAMPSRILKPAMAFFALVFRSELSFSCSRSKSSMSWVKMPLALVANSVAPISARFPPCAPRRRPLPPCNSSSCPMPPLRSRSSAHSAESGAARPVLAPPWLIGVLSAAVCGALWLLYPRQDIERRLVSAGETELSSNYLLNLLRSDPDNPHLRLLLAQHQIARDDTVGAHATLKPLGGMPLTVERAA